MFYVVYLVLVFLFFHRKYQAESKLDSLDWIVNPPTPTHTKSLKTKMGKTILEEKKNRHNDGVLCHSRQTKRGKGGERRRKEEKGGERRRKEEKGGERRRKEEKGGERRRKEEKGGERRRKGVGEITRSHQNQNQNHYLTPQKDGSWLEEFSQKKKKRLIVKTSSLLFGEIS